MLTPLTFVTLGPDPKAHAVMLHHWQFSAAARWDNGSMDQRSACPRMTGGMMYPQETASIMLRCFPVSLQSNQSQRR